MMSPAKTAEPEHVHLTFAKIAPHPHNPRRDVGDVTDLAASIREKGILQPLVVAPWPTDATEKAPRGSAHVLIAGHRRLAAAKAAGLKQVPAVTRPDLDTIPAQLEAMIVENLQRRDLTPVEEAHAYQELLDLKIPVKTIATTTGQTQARVKDRLKLVRIPEAVQDLTHKGQITLTDALAFDEFKDDEKALEDLTAAVGTNDWAHTVNKIRSARELDRKFTDRVRTLEGKGVRFITKEEHDVLVSDTEKPTPRSLAYSSMPGVPYVYEWASDADAIAAQHSACPGHAATADTASRIVRYFCLTPDVHTTAAAEARAETETPEEAEARRLREEAAAAGEAAKEQRRLDRLAAHASRRDWVKSVITAGPSEELVRAVLIEELVTESDRPNYVSDDALAADLAAMLNLSASPTSDELSRPELHEAREIYFRSAFAKQPIHTLVILLDWASRAAAEYDLTERTWGNPWEPGWSREWVERLQTAYGYQLSTFEAEQLAAADGEADES